MGVRNRQPKPWQTITLAGVGVGSEKLANRATIEASTLPAVVGPDHATMMRIQTMAATADNDRISLGKSLVSKYLWRDGPKGASVD